MDEKTYSMDGEPSSANDLIKRACEYDHLFANSVIKQTSVAASILRENGHEVGYVKYQ